MFIGLKCFNQEPMAFFLFWFFSFICCNICKYIFSNFNMWHYYTLFLYIFFIGKVATSPIFLGQVHFSNYISWLLFHSTWLICFVLPLHMRWLRTGERIMNLWKARLTQMLMTEKKMYILSVFNYWYTKFYAKVFYKLFCYKINLHECIIPWKLFPSPQNLCIILIH